MPVTAKAERGATPECLEGHPPQRIGGPNAAASAECECPPDERAGDLAGSTARRRSLLTPPPGERVMRKTPARWKTGSLFVVAVLATAAALPIQEREGTVAVRYVEGTLHGFLRLRTTTGETIADGELLQVPRRRGLDSRMVFRFRDSSFFDERVLFTQRGVFRMESYALVQRGPSFAEDVEVNLERSGKYEVKSTRRSNGEVKTWSGTMDLPDDTYNGMVITIAKNLARGDTQRVHLVAFTPKPRLISLEIAPSGTENVKVGGRAQPAVRFTLKPKLGAVIGFMAKVLGRNPPDSRAWIVTEGAPGFVRFEGPLYTGPAWRLELAAPSWPQ